MNSKIILTVIGVLNILQGIGFFIGAETLTKQSFPAELLEGGGLIMGTDRGSGCYCITSRRWS